MLWTSKSKYKGKDRISMALGFELFANPYLSCTIFNINLYHVSLWYFFFLDSSSPASYMYTVKNNLDLQPEIF